MRINRLILSFALGLLVVSFGVMPKVSAQRKSDSAPSQSQSPGSPIPATQATPALKVNPADVASMDAILAAVYDVISGPAGQKRDWDRMRGLFAPGARLIPTSKNKAGEIGARALTVEDYIERGKEYLEKNGFFEREIARTVERYGHIAQVFSTYESRHKADDKEPFVRGINSFQLLDDGKRWWVVTIYWEGETPDMKIPTQYLPQQK